MTIPFLPRSVRLALALFTLAIAGSAFAQAAYPTKPVTMVVPFAAGTSPDIVARYLSQKLTDRMGQQFIVENRAGAGGMIGAEAVAKARPDGYTTFFMVNSIVTMNQFIYKKLSYDPAKDFAPVSLVAAVPYVLIAHKDFKARTLRELIDMAKAHPGKIDYASMGIGGAGHVLIELFASMAGIHLTHIPYKSNALIDVIGGQVPLISQPTTTALSLIKDGSVIGLATTAPSRLPQLPDVPSIAELVPGYEADGWQGMMVPAGTPAAVIDRLNKELGAVLALPETQERFESLGIRAIPSTPQRMKEVIDSDARKWGKVIRDAGVEAQ